MLSLEGKVALVTGGYKGIGSVFANTLSKLHSDVVVAARNASACESFCHKLKEVYHTNTLAEYVDVSNKESVKALVDSVVKHYGRIDILVNAAGVSGVQKPTVELEEKEFDEVFDIDFKGTLFCSQEVAKVMINQNSGKIINIASIMGKIATPYMTGYCVSKASVIQLTKVMALELARYNIQVNVLCPGYFLTDINKAFFDSEKGLQYIKERIPLKRVGNLEELESTVIYLATAPAFLTGAEIVIDGAQTVI